MHLFRRHSAVDGPSVHDSEHHNYKLAFLLVGLACLFSMIGSVIPFLLRVKSNRVMACALGLSAGVQLMLSVYDMLPEGKEELDEAIPGHGEWAGWCMFAGTIIVVMIFKTLFKRRKSSHVQDIERNNKQESPMDELAEHHHHAIQSTSFQVAVALALHNFPEGVVLFTSTLSSNTLGVATSIGLIFHKLPEGLAIALPSYVSTGSKWKSFFLSLLGSSFFMMLGALSSYFIFRSYWNPLVSGTLVSLTSGFLFYLAVVCLLPLARRLDPKDDVVSLFFLLGVFMIGISKVALSYSELE